MFVVYVCIYVCMCVFIVREGACVYMYMRFINFIIISIYIASLHRPVPVRSGFRFDQMGHVSLEPGNGNVV